MYPYRAPYFFTLFIRFQCITKTTFYQLRGFYFHLYLFLQFEYVVFSYITKASSAYIKKSILIWKRGFLPYLFILFLHIPTILVWIRGFSSQPHKFWFEYVVFCCISSYKFYHLYSLHTWFFIANYKLEFAYVVFSWTYSGNFRFSSDTKVWIRGLFVISSG